MLPTIDPETMNNARALSAEIHRIIVSQPMISYKEIETLGERYQFGGTAGNGIHKTVFVGHPQWVFKTAQIPRDWLYTRPAHRRVRWGTDEEGYTVPWIKEMRRWNRQVNAYVYGEWRRIQQALKLAPKSPHIPVTYLIEGRGLCPALMMERCDVDFNRVTKRTRYGNDAMRKYYRRIFERFDINDNHEWNMGFRSDGTPVIIDWEI